MYSVCVARGTLNSLRAASRLVRLVEGGGSSPQSRCGAEPNRTVTYMVVKATANYRRTSRSLSQWIQ
ncbi:hypothetical protein TNCV_1002131 [Trichonephila clavipes]|nr:hypothetical protein TNCV_1002131 [Trichonephila clavipes]